MPNEKYLALLRQGVDAWNKWREKNLTVEVILVEANLRGVNLKGANLDEVCLVKADFQGANLERANLREAELIGANLSYANLSGAFLLEANLNHANLTKASLQQTKLIETRALAANFTEVVLTGACLHNWHINNATKFDGVICEYVYLKYRYGGRNRKPTQQERYPSSRNFVSGEFTKLFRKALETVDLIFHDDVNWEAFDYSLKKVEVENSGIQLDVQSIEKKDDGIFVVKVSVPPDTDNTKIHNCFMQGYYFAHNFLEAQYQVRIEDKDKYITQLFHLLSEVNENQSEVLKRISEIPKYDMRKSSFLGGFAEKNYGYMVETQHNYAVHQNLVEAATEIQQIFEQLERNKPTTTEPEKLVVVAKAIEEIKDKPMLKQKVISALKSGGTEAFKEATNHPFVNILIATIEGWKEVD